MEPMSQSVAAGMPAAPRDLPRAAGGAPAGRGAPDRGLFLLGALLLYVAAYCFWAQAEDGAMNRAVATPLDDGPSMADLEEFRRTFPSQWIDLHEFAKRQVQTEGPLGLKQLAGAAGFRWRDVNPSGEASMIWYEEAIVEGIVAEAARQRILEYNEDDCRATKALRDWLNGPARHLAHRDDPL